jgi:ATPase family protein associated with various cellular activities (AAA)/AAA lid domain-containing protein
MSKKDDKRAREARALYDALDRYGLAGTGPPREKAAAIRPMEELLHIKELAKLPQPQRPAVKKHAAAPQAQMRRTAKSKTPPGDALTELSAMIGLTPVKERVRLKAAQVENIQARKAHGLPVPVSSHHMVFTGNPGTGKTTVARIVARIFAELGLLEKGHLVETDRAGLVAPYVGQTEEKVCKVLAKARGGVLFIDEAYALAKGHGDTDFGQDAINTILKAMEDERDRLVVIFAGYGDEMEAFLNSNPGLRSRCQTFIAFPDYYPIELGLIFEKLCKEHEFICTPDVSAKVLTLFKAMHAQRGKGFGNGRAARTVFETTWARQALRLSGNRHSTDVLQRLEAQDIPELSEVAGA